MTNLGKSGQKVAGIRADFGNTVAAETSFALAAVALSRAQVLVAHRNGDHRGFCACGPDERTSQWPDQNVSSCAIALGYLGECQIICLWSECG